MDGKPSPEKSGIGFWVVGGLVLAAIVAMLVWPASPTTLVTTVPDKAKSGVPVDAAVEPSPGPETPEGAPDGLTVADPLEAATTAEEIEAYVQQRIDELRREVRSPEDFKRFIGKVRPLLDTAGRKVVALGVASDSKKDIATGLNMRITGVLANPDAKQSAAEAEALIAEAEKLDPALAFPLKQLAFDRRSQPDRSPPGRFEAVVAEGKTLAAVMPNAQMAIGVIQSVLRRAQFQQRAQGKDPEWYSEQFDSLQTFAQSPAFLEPPAGSHDEKEYDRAEVGKRLALMGRLLPGRVFALKAKTIDDKAFDFASLKGKTVLVNFTASWCGPCRAETPHTMKSYKQYNERGFEVVSVGVWDSTANLKRLAEEEKIPWTMLSEELTDKTDGMALGESYGISGVPTCILVGPDGKVLMSEARYPRLQARLEQLFPEPGESEIKPEAETVPAPASAESPAPAKEADDKTEAKAEGDTAGE